MKIAEIQADHFRVPLSTVLSDSTHGEMSHFELVTVRLRSDTGEQGLGYTYTTGVGGAAIHAMITKDLRTLLLQVDPRGIESVWNQMWWRLHWVGRGGAAAFAIAAVDIALWDLKAKQIDEPLWRLLGGNNNRVKAEAYNLPVTTHGVHDIQVHLLAAVSNASYLEVHGFGLERFSRYPFQLDDGEATAPDRPGHGVVLAWEALEAYRQKD